MSKNKFKKTVNFYNQYRGTDFDEFAEKQFKKAERQHKRKLRRQKGREIEYR